MSDILGVDKATEEISNVAIPELVKAATSLLDTLRAALDGATVTITIHLGQPK